MSLTSEPGDFDLSAAWYRKSQGDLRAFLEGFATRMEGAIPGHVTAALQLFLFGAGQQRPIDRLRSLPQTAGPCPH
jgi:hypothetical protein